MGDLIGVESIRLARHASDRVAREVWELPYPAIFSASLRVAQLQARLTAALAEGIRRDRLWMLALGTSGAKRPVAAFLLRSICMSGFSASHLILPMSRADMASHLARKHETVGRALSRLDDLGQFSVLRREVRIPDAEGLRGASEREPAMGHS